MHRRLGGTVTLQEGRVNYEAELHKNNHQHAIPMCEQHLKQEVPSYHVYKMHYLFVHFLRSLIARPEAKAVIRHLTSNNMPDSIWHCVSQKILQMITLRWADLLAVLHWS